MTMRVIITAIKAGAVAFALVVIPLGLIWLVWTVVEPWNETLAAILTVGLVAGIGVAIAVAADA